MLSLLLVVTNALAGDVGDVFGEIPGAVEEVPVDGPIQSQGIAVRAKAVRSTARPADVLAAISKSFRKAGLFIPPPEDQYQLASAPQLTGYDAKAQRSYTAIFKPDGKGTLVILGTADLSHREASKQSLPRFPGAVEAVESSDEGGRVLSYRVNAKPDEVKKFYANVLQAGGWAWKEEGGRWEQSGRAVTLKTQARKDGALSVVVMEKGL
jgi:hypothetical protein